jgi:hypothetical protein
MQYFNVYLNEYFRSEQSCFWRTETLVLSVSETSMLSFSGELKP